MPTREQLHHLIDELPECTLGEAERSLLSLRDYQNGPVLRALLEAPEDDEPETPEERAAIREAYEAIARGDVVADEDLERELGW